MINDEVVTTIRRLIPLAPFTTPPISSALKSPEPGSRVSPRWRSSIRRFTRPCRPMPFTTQRRTIGMPKHQVRRYGFHGTSHHYVAKEAAGYLGKAPESVNLITLHLGNGASAAAVRGG